MVSSISREYVNMCLIGLPFRFRWALNQVFSSRLWLHSHHSKLSSPKSEANIQTFLLDNQNDRKKGGCSAGIRKAVTPTSQSQCPFFFFADVRDGLVSIVVSSNE